jgi:hypothetical protein
MQSTEGLELRGSPIKASTLGLNLFGNLETIREPVNIALGKEMKGWTSPLHFTDSVFKV